MSVWRPDARLAGLVASMWFGEGRTHYQRDRILPSGQSQLLINLGPTQYLVKPASAADDSEERVPFDDVWYSGLHQGPIDTEAPHGNALLGVAFTACGAFPWLGERMDHLADRIVPLADVIGDSARALRERLLNTPVVEARFGLVERWLLSRLTAQGNAHAAVRWAADRIESTAGAVRIEHLAAGTGFSRRHLGNLFREQIGLSPKSLARIHRFRGALDALTRARGEVPWATLAAQGGFYDQPHLVNEFRRITGFSPTELASRARPDTGSVVIR